MSRTPKPTREQRAAARRELAAELHATIATKMETLTRTEEWAAFLDYATKFHAYSLNNLLLILAQRPDASEVAGYNKWLELGRHVRAGEKAIRIRGFSSRKVTEVDTDTGEEADRKVATFPILSVFDVSQTDPNTEVTDWMRKKNPNARLWVDVDQPVQKLTGDDPADIYTRTRDHLTDLGWTVTREPIPGATNGYTTTDGSRRIVVDDALAPAQAAKTIIHEAAHALMHEDIESADYIEHRGRCEVEAESVAYIVAGIARTRHQQLQHRIHRQLVRRQT
ncbi:ArdC-like ssDNA-binding domain-containing protein [Gordonia sp. CPCC 205515]|uniref:ArdC-like ssDNA-binding domain-containing protein n=1 Tax=Gordonia sp. CPCC 205515 TaxID=3140791 RepID=UPI003AF39CA6